MYRYATMTSEKAALHGHLTDEQVRSFGKHGFVLIHDFVAADTCAFLRQRVLEFTAQRPVVKVRWAHSTFDTFNGDQVEQASPELQYMYDASLLRELRRLRTHPLETLADRKVGLSVNQTPIGGTFQPHYDRHVMTAVLYLNDDYAGGEMVFYPRLRFWLGHPSGALKDKAQRILDRVVRNRSFLKAFPREQRLKPTAGDLLIFEGTRTYHAVTPVTGGATRLTAQFGYDAPGMVFDTSEYYGKQVA